MPGFSAVRFPELLADDREEYTCSICQEIFNTPVTTTCCRQTFCEDCINEWLKTNTTCPYDRKPLTQTELSPAPRMVTNMLGKLRIQCEYWYIGCHEVVKLDDLPKHTVNCRYKVEKCVKCECEQTPGHDCIAALLAENRELKKKLAAEQVVNKAAKYMDKVNLDECGSTHIVCTNGHQELKPGHDCIEELRAHNDHAQLEIDGLKRALEAAKLALVTNTQGIGVGSTAASDTALMSDHQLLAECRRHMSAPELVTNHMKADMSAKTLLIIGLKLTIQNTLYHVCKQICDTLDFEFGTSWHCMAYASDAPQAYRTPNRRNLMRVKMGPLTLLIFQTDTFTMANLKERLRCNKIHRNIDIAESEMRPKMVEAVKAVTFEAIQSSNTMEDLAESISVKMAARYRGKIWQCAVASKYSVGCLVTTAPNAFIEYKVDQLYVILFQAI